jgi:hypothetical protein
LFKHLEASAQGTQEGSQVQVVEYQSTLPADLTKHWIIGTDELNYGKTAGQPSQCRDDFLKRERTPNEQVMHERQAQHTVDLPLKSLCKGTPFGVTPTHGR